MFAKKKTQPTTTTTKNETPDYIVRLREEIREAYEFAEEFLRDYGTDWKLHNKLCDMLKSALAAPLRNCDVPHKDDHELWLRWQAFCAEIYPSRMSFSTWLLDLAQEGGAK